MSRTRRGSRPTEDLVPDVPQLNDEDFWEDLTSDIAGGRFIPVISNSFINNYILDIDFDGDIGISNNGADDLYEDCLTIDEELAESWAESIEYPLAEEPFKLTRVAQYNQVANRRIRQAKKNYLTFLKDYLLDLASADKDVVPEARDNLESRVNSLSFSDIATELGYPKFKNERDHPLRLLAELPIKYYLTTSHHDFMERALRDAGKDPQTEFCGWYHDTADPRGHRVRVSKTEPLVFHLYGTEEEPGSLVISEDDYLEFLVKVSENRDFIPVSLRGAMAESSLLLLGYRLRDWDFRVLLRGVILPSALQGSTVAIQLDQRAQQWEESQGNPQEKARRYLVRYFGNLKGITVEWDDACAFVYRLSKEVKERRI